MNALENFVDKSSGGESVIVPWSDLRTNFSGDTNRLRWCAMLNSTKKAKLLFAANDRSVKPSGEIVSTSLVFWIGLP